MADARALLRAERASRRITHPHASYTGDGKLLCNLCETLVKSEAHWQSHLHSTQHNLRSQRQHDVAARKGSGGDGGGAKKRKAASPDSPPVERKKARAEAVVRDAGRGDDETDAVVQDAPIIETASTPTKAKGTPPPAIKPPTPTADDPGPEDVLALERELDSLEADAVREEQVALRNAATISAAPMTAEELAAQAREQQSAQRGRRELELEEEREDAARVVEQEMEEMEALEERLKRLRERRERLRDPGDDVVVDDGGVEVVAPVTNVDGDDFGREGSSDDEDEEDFDEWKFGGS